MTAPICVCNLSYLLVNIGPCDPGPGTFEINGFVEFESAPSTGVLTISDCNGNSTDIFPPFVSPTNYILPGLTPDGTTNCTVTAVFSDDPSCSITSSSFGYPQDCSCPVDAGTFTTNTTGSTTSGYQLCFGDSYYNNT